MNRAVLRVAVLAAGLSVAWTATAQSRTGGRLGAALDRLGCTSCHLSGEPLPYLFASFDQFRRSDTPQAAQCALCHVGNQVAARTSPPAAWLPLSREMLNKLAGFHAYVRAPALDFGGGEGEPRYTDCGLEAFLAAPVPRAPEPRESMFPLEPDARQQLRRALVGALESCDSAADATRSVALESEGERLFGQLGCIGCHSSAGQAPRLRIGIPLLSRAWFAKRVRAGSDTGGPHRRRIWQAVDARLVARDDASLIMPGFPQLEQADIDALYAYVASSRADLPVSRGAGPAIARPDVPPAVAQKLFREVQRRVFDTSCRHCHSADPRDQRSIQAVFGKAQSAEPGILPMSRLPTPSPEQLRRVLGRDCATSPLLQRLRARAHEWSGQRRADAPRGMPLTMPPLMEEDLRLVETWRAVGCPSDRGALCEPCELPSEEHPVHAAAERMTGAIDP